MHACLEPRRRLATRFCGAECTRSSRNSTPPRRRRCRPLTRAASTGVDAYALFRAIDIDDSSAVPVEELLLCGAALGAQ